MSIKLTIFNNLKYAKHIKLIIKISDPIKINKDRYEISLVINMNITFVKTITEVA